MKCPYCEYEDLKYFIHLVLSEPTGSKLKSTKKIAFKVDSLCTKIFIRSKTGSTQKFNEFLSPDKLEVEPF